MDFIVKLISGVGVESTLIYLCATAFLGLLLGKISIKGVRLGIAGVLFMGIILAHFKSSFGYPPLDSGILHFVKEFGLVLFVYSIGIEVGPRFLSSFKNDGMKLNGMVLATVLLGAIIVVILKYTLDMEPAVIVGLFSGAVTNTPGLGAAQQALGADVAAVEASGMAYAMAYPFGVLGIILVIILTRLLFKIKIDDAEREYNEQLGVNRKNQLESVQITVTNSNWEGRTIAELKKMFKDELVISRIQRGEQLDVAVEDEIIKMGDVIFGVSTLEHEEKFTLSIGPVETGMKKEVSGALAMFNVLVTNRKIAGKTIEHIGIYRRYEANITRILRSGMEILPTLNTTIEMGDTLRVVGKRALLPDIRKEIGNSVKELSIPNSISIFLGIFLGVLVGSIPIWIPGLPVPAKLGLAGGPLIVALILGHKGRVGQLDFYMTPGANAMLRELGIILFLGCVGLSSGTRFISTLVDGGYMWMLYGMIITFVPAMTIAVTAHFMGVNYLKICGFLAGVSTNPPALGYANSISDSQAQSTAYATVYPLTMFLRIFTAQLLVLIL